MKTDPPRDDAGYLWDMLDCASSVVSLVSGKTLADYRNSRPLRRAVEREVEIIGEAARHVSEAFQLAHPEIPWRQIIAQRHVLSHDYGEIDDERIWRVATVHIPNLNRLLQPLIPPPPTPKDAP